MSGLGMHGVAFTQNQQKVKRMSANQHAHALYNPCRFNIAIHITKVLGPSRHRCHRESNLERYHVSYRKAARVLVKKR